LQAFLFFHVESVEQTIGRLQRFCWRDAEKFLATIADIQKTVAFVFAITQVEQHAWQIRHQPLKPQVAGAQLRQCCPMFGTLLRRAGFTVDQREQAGAIAQYDCFVCVGWCIAVVIGGGGRKIQHDQRQIESRCRYLRHQRW